MAGSNEPARFGSTVALVPIHSIIPEREHGDGAILVMRDGSFRMVVQTSSVNFDMKSEAERTSLTMAFGALVDSLEVDFPIQIVSHSQPVDTDAYAAQFESRLNNDRTPPQIKEMIRAHLAHFQETVKHTKMYLREIYVVIPFKGTQGPLESGVLDQIPGASIVRALGRKMDDRIDHKPTDMEITAARQTLEIRSNQILARLYQIGLDAHRLDADEVRRLLYRLYHPSLSERQRDPGFEDSEMFAGFSAPPLPAATRRNI